VKKLLAGVAAATTIVVLGAPSAGADLTRLLIQSAMEDLIEWDPEFAEIAPTASPESHHQFVAGSLKVSDGQAFQHTRVSAHSGPGGIDPHGSVRLTHNIGGSVVDVKGDVECVDVLGRVATLNARLRVPRPGGETHITLQVLDGGNPGVLMGESPDAAQFGFTRIPLLPPPPLQPRCGAAEMEVIGEPRGNLVVKDDSP
jgi:hypothetical protein